MVSGRKKKRSLAAFGMEEDGVACGEGQEDATSGWETAAMDTGDAGDQGGTCAGSSLVRVKPQKATRGNRTKRQKV